MQLAFSTLGCPSWTFEEIITQAQQMGYAGLEFRGILDQVELTQVPEFSSAQIADTRKRLADAGLVATCLSSSVQVVAAGKDEVSRRQAISTAERYFDMAKEMDAPFVRLFCGNYPDDMLHAEAIEKAITTLRTIGDFAQARGVTAVVETHDAFTSTAPLADLIRVTNHPAVQILWDIHHPYRAEGESLEQSLRNLNGFIKYTHLKDSVMDAESEKFTYVPIGTGDVPLFEAIHALKQSGYDGFLTLEWEKRWHPELAAPEIVFDHYAEQMRVWLAEL